MSKKTVENAMLLYMRPSSNHESWDSVTWYGNLQHRHPLEVHHLFQSLSVGYEILRQYSLQSCWNIQCKGRAMNRPAFAPAVESNNNKLIWDKKGGYQKYDSWMRLFYSLAGWLGVGRQDLSCFLLVHEGRLEHHLKYSKANHSPDW